MSLQFFLTKIFFLLLSSREADKPVGVNRGKGVLYILRAGSNLSSPAF